MARIRGVEIRGFRSIQSLDWFPMPGVNCLVGSGDSGKSTVLDAIDACLSPRRGMLFSDTDFYNLNVEKPISIKITLGNLPDHLKDLDVYGEYLRSYDGISDAIDDEPQKGDETVITIELQVNADLEPVWRLYSDRTATLDPRSLPWKERWLLAPTRLGNHGSANLSWTRGSVLNRLSEDRVDVSLELLNAAREARDGFGERAGVQLRNTLDIVTTTANSLGVSVGTSARALLDAHAASFGEGAISLHSEAGIPLRRLGTGSSRLLLAGLHRAAADTAQIVLVDEVEFGLEPHRLTRLLHSLGSKDNPSPLQVFMTTHSPVAVRELTGNQLHVLHNQGPTHIALLAGSSDEVQSTLRMDPEAFLAKTVIVCEGASEIGMVRGLDLYFSKQHSISLHSEGVAFVNANGGSPDKCLARAMAIGQLGYRVIALIDNDKAASLEELSKFEAMGGSVITWPPGMALEDVLFAAFPVALTDQLLTRAVELVSEQTVDADISTAAGLALTSSQIWHARQQTGDYSPAHRKILGAAARLRKKGWFKSITKMEDLFGTIIAPQWSLGSAEFQEVVNRLYALARAPHAKP